MPQFPLRPLPAPDTAESFVLDLLEVAALRAHPITHSIGQLLAAQAFLRWLYRCQMSRLDTISLRRLEAS